MKYFIYARKSSEDKNKQIASIDDQITEMTKIAEQLDLEIVKIFSESKSAKKPNNRAQFSQMVQELYEGKADGIICWKLDRLARNPMDAGMIKQMLQDGTIKKIQTHEKEYQTGDNVLLMDVEFGIANQFILDLSKNTKRGLNSKAERGEFPSRAPIGYLNNTHEQKGKKGIRRDPEKFILMKKLWDHALTGKYTLHQLSEIAYRELGLTGFNGKPVYRTVIYNALRNPFYYGNFIWGGKEYVGNHEAMISKSEFLKVQEHLSEKTKIDKDKKYYHPYTTMFRCSCGNQLTAEKKKKKLKGGGVNIHTYYHCTNRKHSGCREAYLHLESLEEQILSKTRTLKLPEKIQSFCLNYLLEQEKSREAVSDQSIANKQKEVVKIQKKLDNLLDMRMNGEIDSDNYMDRKKRLEDQVAHLQAEISEIQETGLIFIYEQVQEAFDFNAEYQQALEKGDDSEKRFLVKKVGSEYSYTNGEISIEFKPIYQEVRLLVENIYSELGVIEPEKTLVKQESFTDLDVLCPVMGD